MRLFFFFNLRLCICLCTELGLLLVEFPFTVFITVLEVKAGFGEGPFTCTALAEESEVINTLIAPHVGDVECIELCTSGVDLVRECTVVVIVVVFRHRVEMCWS